MPADTFVDYYRMLQVTKHATPDQIRASYVALAKRHHPDVGGSIAMMQKLNQAYKTLAVASSRKAYDMLHDFHVSGAAGSYREHGQATRSATDMTDDDIDRFIDSIYNEYHNSPKQKQTILGKLKRIISTF